MPIQQGEHVYVSVILPKSCKPCWFQWTIPICKTVSLWHFHQFLICTASFCSAHNIQTAWWIYWIQCLDVLFSDRAIECAILVNLRFVEYRNKSFNHFVFYGINTDHAELISVHQPQEWKKIWDSLKVALSKWNSVHKIRHNINQGIMTCQVL